MRILQLVDSLALGGAEAVAVQLANGLAAKHESHLCATRAGGPLASRLTGRVQTLCLQRRSRWDRAALSRLRAYVQRHSIDLVHAHSSSILLAQQLRLTTPRASRPSIIWHDHYGRYATHPRNRTLYRLLTSGIGGVISVNEPLRQWALELGRPPERCWYVANAVRTPYEEFEQTRIQNGDANRIICVANFRPQKRHDLLLQAFADLRSSDAHLDLVGSATDSRRAELETQAKQLGVLDRVTFHGPVDDPAPLLRRASLGVLASSSEGLPLALLEYGAAGLAPVVTDVGQMGEVVANADLLVPSEDPKALSQAIDRLLANPTEREHAARRFFDRVRTEFGEERMIEQVVEVAKTVLEER